MWYLLALMSPGLILAFFLIGVFLYLVSGGTRRRRRSYIFLLALSSILTAWFLAMVWVGDSVPVITSLSVGVALVLFGFIALLKYKRLYVLPPKASELSSKDR